MRLRRAWLPLARLLLFVVAGGCVLLGGNSSSASAAGLPLERALRNYGWRPEAIAYITAHTHLVETPDGAGSPCPRAVACSVADGSVYVNQVPSNPATLDYVLNHEYIHAIEFARGSADGTIGSILADVLDLSNDTDHPLAALAARRVLGLTGRDDHPVISTQDWYHIEHYVLEDIGWDVANLPDWYRLAYFPYLAPNPAVRKAVSVTQAPPPKDGDLRMQRVLDAIVTLCGPMLPGARLSAPSVACGPRALWANVPYAPLGARAAPPPRESALPAAADSIRPPSEASTIAEATAADDAAISMPQAMNPLATS